MGGGVEVETVAVGTARTRLVRLRAGCGVRATLLSAGAALREYWLPDRRGLMADVVLAPRDIAEQLARPLFLGETVGRYANRIAGARFELDGRTYRLGANDGRHSLHGGGDGFDRREWELLETGGGEAPWATFALLSPDGGGGYPGAVSARVRYALSAGGTLSIAMEAEVSAPTILNMTNHALYNLAGEGTAGGILGHRLMVPAGRYTPVDAELIPTGELAPVVGTPLDFREGRMIGEALAEIGHPQLRVASGIDHNLVLDAAAAGEPRLVARLEHPPSGRTMEMRSTEPGVQLYSGNFLDGTIIGKAGRVYGRHAGLAMEPQKFPDTPNRPQFGSARVEPGAPYRHLMLVQPGVV